MSYLQIKSLIDEQIRLLNTPLKVDDEIRALLASENVPEDKLRSVIFKYNLLIKRHNRNRFNKQVVHQIVHQVVQAEKDKITKVNAALEKISTLVQPILLPDFSRVGGLEERTRMVNQLASELPEPNHLFAVYKDIEIDVEKSDSELDEELQGGEDHLIQDDEEHVTETSKKKLRKQYQRAIQKDLDVRLARQGEVSKEWKERYASLRSKILGMNEELIYKLQKLVYLRKLNAKLAFLGGHEDTQQCDSEVEEESDADEVDGDVSAQIKRFEILVEKLEFALT